MDSTFPYPDYGGNACAHLSSEDRERLWRAACTLVDARGLIVKITGLVGRSAEWAGGKAFELGDKVFGAGWQEKFREYAEDLLWRGYNLAALGLDPKAEKEPWFWFNRIVVSATGAVGGFFGFSGLAIDIPVSTLMIMRSIAEIARSHGEDIASDEGKRACLEVMALGGPGTEDDDIDVSYWSTRALLAHTAIEQLVKQVAARFGVVLSEKVLAQLVPVTGAVAGGGLNYVFMDFYQQMARVHFTIRALERAYGADGSVRSCFDRLVRQAKARRRVHNPEAGSALSET